MGVFLFLIIIFIALLPKWVQWADNANEKERQRTSEYRKMANGKPFCPICGCVDLSANNRGYSMVTGTMGSKDVYVTCLKCGHRWKAGDYNHLYKD